MYLLSGFLLTISLVAGMVGLIKPSVFDKLFRGKATRKSVVLLFGAIFIASALVAGVTEPQSVKDARVEKSSQKNIASLKKNESNEQLQTKPILYKVIKVIDGDTVDVDISGKTQRLRLIGIDTPETNDPRKPVECFAKEAKSKLTELLTNKQVKLEADASQDNRDKYDRLLRYIILDGKNVNKQLIEEGYAFEYTYKIPYKFQREFKAAENNARASAKGLWATNTCNGEKGKPVTVVPTVKPQPSPPAPKTPPESQSSGCDANYSGGCVPNVSYDLDCSDISFSVKVVGTDKHRFDRDGDGYGCESN